VDKKCADGWCRIPAGCLVMGAAPCERVAMTSALASGKVARSHGTVPYRWESGWKAPTANDGQRSLTGRSIRLSGPAREFAGPADARPRGSSAHSVCVEQLRLGGLAEPPADHLALEIGWVASWCELGRVDGLAKPAEVALDAG